MLSHLQPAEPACLLSLRMHKGEHLLLVQELYLLGLQLREPWLRFGSNAGWRNEKERAELALDSDSVPHRR